MNASPTSGEGAVAIWHDIASEGRADFYAWHGSEHMPERVGIPGFLRGRRFIAVDADLEFFNLYETQSLAVVKGDDYRARLNNPTPWTRSTVMHFRRVARSLCRVAAIAGNSSAQGGLVASLRYDVEPTQADAHAVAIARDLLPALAAAPGIAVARLLLADDAASGEINAEQKARGASNDTPRCVLIIEGWGDESAFADTIKRELAPEKLAPTGALSAARLGVYRHQLTLIAP